MNTSLPTNQYEDKATKNVAYAIYILYLTSVILPMLPIVGIIFAYVFENDAQGNLKSHYRYLIRSFWIGLLYFAISGALIVLVIGIVLLPLCVIWWIIRIAKGLKALIRNEAISQPQTWWF
jgi:uncharacterized membrane protein